MYNQLSREQRYAIYLGLKRGATLTSIAQEIGACVSTVSREIKRNSNRHGRYIYDQAHELAMVKRERSCANRKIKPWLMKKALTLLMDKQWSPQQISGRLALGGQRISHETIYKAIRADTSGELRKHCRHKLKYRRHIHQQRPTKASNIKHRVSIHDRPPEADGTRRGDWEMDLIIGKEQKSALVTLTDRHNNYLLIKKIPNKKPKTVAKAVWQMLLPFKGPWLKTITTDNGSEFADHELISKWLNVPIYFADSYCSWQKGCIENANKLIRQYFPKGTDFNHVSVEDIMSIQKKINDRPRLKLNFLTPKEVFYELVC